MSEKKFSYTIKKSKRAKRMRLAVYCDGSVVVTSPTCVRQSAIDQFIADKKKWAIGKINFFSSVERKPVRAFSREDYLKYKGETLKFAKERVEFYSRDQSFPLNKICIRNQKTRWGSCSKRGNINLNYKIFFLPEALRDYIIVHELCHLKEFNHSQSFWALVGEIIPNYINIKKELRKYELAYR